MTARQMPSSLEIAQSAVLRPVEELAAELGLAPEEVDLYGRFKAKIDLSVLDRLAANPDAKLIDVTAITPTKAGEGKTTTSVSLTQGLGHIGKQPVLCLREAGEIADLDARHEHAAAGIDLDELLLGEPPERLSHRGAANPEPLDQPALVDHRAGPELE